jgi:hypothetical protein
LFVNPIRIWAPPSLISTTFEIQVTIFGENLPKPIHDVIKSRIV